MTNKPFTFQIFFPLQFEFYTSSPFRNEVISGGLCAAAAQLVRDETDPKELELLLSMHLWVSVCTAELNMSLAPFSSAHIPPSLWKPVHVWVRVQFFSDHFRGRDVSLSDRGFEPECFGGEISPGARRGFIGRRHVLLSPYVTSQRPGRETGSAQFLAVDDRND